MLNLELTYVHYFVVFVWLNMLQNTWFSYLRIKTFTQGSHFIFRYIQFNSWLIFFFHHFYIIPFFFFSFLFWNLLFLLLFTLIEVFTHYWNAWSWSVVQITKIFNNYRVKYRALKFITCQLFGSLSSLRNVIFESNYSSLNYTFQNSDTPKALNYWTRENFFG